MEKLDEADSSYYIPTDLAKVIDPPPFFWCSGKINVIRMSLANVTFGSWTDGIEAYQIMESISGLSVSFLRFTLLVNNGHWNSVKIKPLLSSPSQPNLPLNCSIVAWNVRHVNRSCFASRLSIIMRIYNPHVLLLTETRVTFDQWVMCCGLLPSHLEWEVVDSIGLNGGFITIRDPSVVRYHVVQGVYRSPAMVCHGFLMPSSVNC